MLFVLLGCLFSNSKPNWSSQVADVVVLGVPVDVLEQYFWCGRFYDI